MHTGVEILKKILYDFALKDLSINWGKSITAENGLLHKIRRITVPLIERLSKGENIEQIFEEYTIYYDEIYQLVEHSQEIKATLNYIPDFQIFFERMESLLWEVPVKFKEEQRAERFYVQQGDPYNMRILKPVKNTIYRISILPLKSLNRVRLLFKKQPRPIKFWPHTVKYQSLLRYHFQYQFLLDLERYRNKLNERLMLTIHNTWQSINSSLPDEYQYLDRKGLNLLKIAQDLEKVMDEMERNLEVLIHNLNSELTNLINERILYFEHDYLLAGTSEYANRKLNGKKIYKNIKKAESIWDNNTQGWGNTYYAIIDDWKGDLEIYKLRNRLIRETFRIGKLQDQDEYRFRDEFKSIDLIFNEALDNLKSREQNLKKSLLETKYLITKKLSNDLIPSISEKISAKNLSGLLNLLENTVESSLQMLSESHVIVKAEIYGKPLKSSELESISVADLTAYELLPKLKETFTDVRNQFFVKLAEINELIFDLDNIVVFGIETADSNAEDPKSDPADSLKLAFEGIERAKNKLGQINSNVQSIYVKSYNAIFKAVEEFNDQLKGFTDNENVLSLKVRIVKSRAIEQSKALRKEFRVKVLNGLKIAGTYSIQYIGKLYAGFTKYRMMFLLTAPKPVLSREISDFLAYSNKKIDELPLLYKNLYKIQPIRDTELFVGRTEELEKLRKAYQNWIGGNYAATAVIGEKWGGTTSLISNFIATTEFHYKIFRIGFTQRILDDSELVLRISRESGQNETRDLENLIESLNGLPAKRIIILEDIQKIYLRRVDGFSCLRTLFQLINSTNKNIFWLASCTIYAWNFLDNALSIHDYFSHIIFIGKLKEQEIVDIIKKRNRISGLHVIFEPDDNKVLKKKLKGLPDEEQQVHLRKSYFDDLGSFSESNISLALIFWLLSTREITENKLIIGHFEKPDLSFVNVLSADRVMTLLALILHDGLNETELAKVNHITHEEAKFLVMMLLEDGIIYKENGSYLVNPLIYRNVIKHLQSKNLIH